MPAPAAVQQAVAGRRAKVVRMRSTGIPPTVIARELGVSVDVVYQDVSVVLKARRDELAADADLLVAAQVEELEAVRRTAWANALRRHYHVTPSGTVARDPETGEPLIDTAPVDRALGVVIKAQERMARLLGLDAATRVRAEVEHEVRLEDIDRAVSRLREQVERERARYITQYGRLPDAPVIAGG